MGKVVWDMDGDEMKGEEKMEMESEFWRIKVEGSA